MVLCDKQDGGGVGVGDGSGVRGCVYYRAESHCCMAEANTIMLSNYPPIKNNIKIIYKKSYHRF